MHITAIFFIFQQDNSINIIPTESTSTQSKKAGAHELKLLFLKKSFTFQHLTL